MARVRAHGLRSGAWIRPERRLALYLRDGFRCVYCKRDLHDAAPRELTLDHLRPRCLGGSNANTNLVTACLSCNSRRQHQSWTVFCTPERRPVIERARRRKPNMALALAVLAGTVNRAEVCRAEA